MMNENLSNGIPSQRESVRTGPPSDKAFVPFNGVDSSHSSRNSSPGARFQEIPLSQLPPSKADIPPSQLPPNRPIPTSGLLGPMSRMSVSKGNEQTPFSSPKVPTAFSTSTPLQDTSVTQNLKSSAVSENVLSPIASNQPSKPVERDVNPQFTHSSTSQFTSVKSIAGGDANRNIPQDNTKTSSYFPQAGNVSITPKVSESQNTATLRGPSMQVSKVTSQTASLFPAGQQNVQQFPNLQSGQKVGQPNNNFLNGNQGQLPRQIPQGPLQRFPSSQQPQHVNSFAQQSAMPQGSQFQNIKPPMQTQLRPNTSSTPTMPTPMQSSIQQTQPHLQPAQTIQSNLQQPEQNYQSTQQQFTSQNIQQHASTHSQGFSQVPPQKVPATASDQSRAHLHTNRYPQRPVAAPSQQFNQSPSSFQTQQNYPSHQQQSNIQNPQSNFPSRSNFPQSQNQPNYPSQQPQPSSFPPNPQSSNFPQSHTQQNYPQQPSNYPPGNNYPQNQTPYQYSNPTVTQSGFNKLWGAENFDLLQCPTILPATSIEPPKFSVGQEFLDAANCSTEIVRCTMTKIPETIALLQKSRLPLGVLIHPFKDLNHLPVIQCNAIVRCRTCRTYINPFVYFVDSKRWKCNLCYRVNELPEEFQYDPVSKTYGDPSRRPEVKSSTIEYIAPAEYMLRPPQPAVYMYLFDVSRLAIESGYLHTVCNVLSAEISNIPGDARTQIGFLAYDSALHFYSLSEGQNQPHEMTVLDVEDPFVPCPDNLLVNLQDRMELITDLLTQLPQRFLNTGDTGSALGAALQIAYKMTAATGGRITVFQTTLPNTGPGRLTPREDPNQRSSSEVQHLNPVIDFYKRLALECSGQQVAVDLFVLNSQYVDLATISGISRFSGGCIYHFPLFKASRAVLNDGFEKAFRRYVTRKIGFEAVMRIRCTRGLTIHTFHGNFFVRSTDLLSLPNINPDAGFGMQVKIEENLSDVQSICFQAALLYTSSKGERRIRVHTLCLPVANTVQDVINSADQQCIIGLLAKMAVDRSMQSSLSDAREAFLNVAIDILSSYKLSLNMGTGVSGLMAPDCLKLLPLYISALLKSLAFRVGTSTRLDDRVKAMCDMKTKPLPYLIQQIYPDLYPVHNLEEQRTILNSEEEQINVPPHLQLTARNLDSNGAYLLDTGDHMMLFVCSNISPIFLRECLDVHEYNSLTDDIYELPLLDNPNSRRLQAFVNYLNDDKPYPATLQVIKENSQTRVVFLERLIEDRMENSLSYHEFLQHVKSQVK